MSKSSFLERLIAWVIWIFWACVRGWKKCEKKDGDLELVIEPGQACPPVAPPPLSSGEETLKMLQHKHFEYMDSDREEAPPVVELTVKQCFHLLNCIEVGSRDFNPISSLARGGVKIASFASVRIKIKKDSNVV